MPEATLGAFAIKRAHIAVEPPSAFSEMISVVVRLEPEYDVDGLSRDAKTEMKQVVHPKLWKKLSHRERAEVVRRVVLEAVIHEVDEWLRVDGERVVEPHPERMSQLERAGVGAGVRP